MPPNWTCPGRNTATISSPGGLSWKPAADTISLGEQQPVFAGEGEHPPLWLRELLAVLPFQRDEQSFLIAVYEMTYDITQPAPGNRYRLTLQGLPRVPLRVRLYDPLHDQDLPLPVVQQQEDRLTVELWAQDYPCLLSLTRSVIQ